MSSGYRGFSALSSVVSRFRSLLRGLRRRDVVETEMVEEFRHHLELRTEDLMRQGLPPQEAARRARLEFGHVETHREAARASRGLRGFDQLGFSWLDVKLGARMLAKYPGLSLVSVIGMSVAIAIGAGGFGFIHALVDSPLPLDEGERIVSLQNSDAKNPGQPEAHALHDFVFWRDELRSVRDVSAFRTEHGSLVIPGGSSGNVRMARMSASGFRVARVAPVLGRPLVDDDERAGAPPVVVIAHEEWQSRFVADPAIIGRPVQLDGAVHTVVGVMPEGFRFPIDYRYWVPLRLNPSAHAVGSGPEIQMFGRLADGASVEQAQAELTLLGRRMTAAYPQTHAHLRPWIRPYTHTFVGIDSPARAWTLRGIQLALSLLLVVVSVNVAILVYARTAARTGEIVVRTALGASRRRVVTQLFAEALVLSLTAAAVAVALIGIAFDWFERLMVSGNEQIPFWISIGISPTLVAYAVGLAVLAAAIVGVAPALKATGRALHGSLQQLSTRGSRMQLGRTWTALVVLQVGVAVAVLPYAIWSAGRFVRSGFAAPTYPVDEFVHAFLSVERERTSASRDSAAYETALEARFTGSVRELVERVAAEPAVAGVAVARLFPGSEESQNTEIDGVGDRAWTWVNEVDVGLFDVLDVPILAGRGFVEADAVPGATAVIVDRVFAERVLGGGNVLGRRVRQWRWQDGVVRDPGPWLEIVGVVPAFTPPPPFEQAAPKLYRALVLADASGSVHLAVRMKPDAPPSAFQGRLRELIHDVDPALRIRDLQTAAQEERQRREGILYLGLAVVAITGSVLLLSAAGIYAMMSFIVASRRREIGIRAALGAAPRRVLAGIFRRAGAQLGAGVLGGLLVAESIPRLMGGSFFAGEGALMLPIVAGIMLAIGLAAAIGPARRGLAVQPTEALREE